MAIMLSGQLSLIVLVAAMLGGGGVGPAGGAESTAHLAGAAAASSDFDQLELVTTSVELDSLFGSKEPESTTLYPILSFALHNRGTRDVVVDDFAVGAMGDQLSITWTCGEHRIDTKVINRACIRQIFRGGILIPVGGCKDFSVLLRQPLRIHHEGGRIRDAMRHCVATVGVGPGVSICDELRVISRINVEDGEAVTDAHAGAMATVSEAEVKEIVEEMQRQLVAQASPEVRVPVVGVETRIPVRLIHREPQ